MLWRNCPKNFRVPFFVFLRTLKPFENIFKGNLLTTAQNVGCPLGFGVNCGQLILGGTMLNLKVEAQRTS